jgi:hypothetical protein
MVKTVLESEVFRCPKCQHLTTVKVADDMPYVSLSAGAYGPYFVCQNPRCDVERIYGTKDVMVSGRE